MKTGIELIAQERQEQLTKHGRTVESDVENNNYSQLSNAAKILIDQPVHVDYDEETYVDVVPFKWDEKLFTKMKHKSYLDRLIISGALIAAEIDRINFIDQNRQPEQL